MTDTVFKYADIDKDGFTTETLVIKEGFWRHSTQTLETWRCKASPDGGWSPCRGGPDAGGDGDGYCINGTTGPLCDGESSPTDPNCHAPVTRVVPCVPSNLELARAAGLPSIPDQFLCLFSLQFAPPNSSAVAVSPIAALTRGGPPKNIVPVLLTMMASSLMAGT